MVLNPADYQVVWVAPLEIELQAALEMLDEQYDDNFPVRRGDNYVYFAGRMCGRNVAIASFPQGTLCGINSAAALVSQVEHFFTNLWLVFLVGVAAGLPDLSRNPVRDIRLGDILVAAPNDGTPAIVHYGQGKETEAGLQQLRSGHVLHPPKQILMAAVTKAKFSNVNSPTHYLKFLKEFDTAKFPDPGQREDKLYDANGDEVPRRPREPTKRTKIWYGPIGSGDKLLKNATKRDELRDEFKIIGLEMAGAGTNAVVPAAMIRGVCDYGDQKKNKQWQPHAAAKAAAYAKSVLAQLPPLEDSKAEQNCVPLTKNTVLGESY